MYAVRLELCSTSETNRWTVWAFGVRISFNDTPSHIFKLTCPAKFMMLQPQPRSNIFINKDATLCFAVFFTTILLVFGLLPLLANANHLLKSADRRTQYYNNPGPAKTTDDIICLIKLLISLEPTLFDCRDEKILMRQGQTGFHATENNQTRPCFAPREGARRDTYAKEHKSENNGNLIEDI